MRTKKTIEFLGDFLECKNDLTKILNLKRKIKEILKKNNINVLKETHFIFEPTKGATFLYLLSESHLAIHTWPEKGLVNVDFYLCNFKKDNTKKVENAYKELIELFSPQKVITKKITRLN
jgi:S-adenosylmethionine/arginine decarboxylase-like enzyme